MQTKRARSRALELADPSSPFEPCPRDSATSRLPDGQQSVSDDARILGMAGMVGVAGAVRLESEKRCGLVLPLEQTLDDIAGPEICRM